MNDEEIGERVGMSDRGIGVWRREYNLPRHKRHQSIKTTMMKSDNSEKYKRMLHEIFFPTINDTIGFNASAPRHMRVRERVL
jgi:hypothetical protein